MLDKLSSSLSALQIKADIVREGYRKQLQAAASRGFMTNYTEVLCGDKFNRFSHHIDGMLEIINHSRQDVLVQKEMLEELIRPGPLPPCRL